MVQPEVELCEVCQKAQATVHLCQAVANHPQKMTSQDYCEECYRQREAAAGREAEILPTEIGACYYCGNPAKIGGPNTGPALKIRKQKYHWKCGPCLQLYGTLLKMELTGKAADLSEAEAENRLAALISRVDDQVRQMVGKT